METYKGKIPTLQKKYRLVIYNISNNNIDSYKIKLSSLIKMHKSIYKIYTLMCHLNLSVSSKFIFNK